MLILSFHDAGAERGGSGMGACWSLKAVLLDLGGSTMDLDGRGAEGEGLGLGDRAGILDTVALPVLRGAMRVDVLGVAWRWAPAAVAGREGTEARSVGCGLGTELSEVEIRASFVAAGHGLSELPLGPKAVEDDAVDDDAKGLDDHFDDAADKSPVLKVASKSVSDVVLEQMPPLVVNARPSPHILAVALRLALVQNTSADCPHDDAEDEEGNGKDGVVRCNLFCSPVTTAAISSQYYYRHEQ